MTKFTDKERQLMDSKGNAKQPSQKQAPSFAQRMKEKRGEYTQPQPAPDANPAVPAFSEQTQELANQALTMADDAYQELRSQQNTLIAQKNANDIRRDADQLKVMLDPLLKRSMAMLLAAREIADQVPVKIEILMGEAQAPELEFPELPGLPEFDHIYSSAYSEPPASYPYASLVGDGDYSENSATTSEETQLSKPQEQSMQKPSSISTSSD